MVYRVTVRGSGGRVVSDTLEAADLADALELLGLVLASLAAMLAPGERVVAVELAEDVSVPGG